MDEVPIRRQAKTRHFLLHRRSHSLQKADCTGAKVDAVPCDPRAGGCVSPYFVIMTDPVPWAQANSTCTSANKTLSTIDAIFDPNGASRRAFRV